MGRGFQRFGPAPPADRSQYRRPRRRPFGPSSGTRNRSPVRRRDRHFTSLLEILAMKSGFHSSNRRRCPRVEFPTQGDRWSMELREAVKRRLATILGRFRERIGAVGVYLNDVNGPRGGIDKRCRVELTCFPRDRITATASATFAERAVTTALRRARTLLLRKLRRERPGRSNLEA
jgi:putative sigma-54 modulation protein